MNPESDNNTLRILIVDDSPHFLDAARLAQDGIAVVGVASTSAP
jgi:hypothetical protein